MRVQHELFKSSVGSWESLCDEAAAFASRIGRGRPIDMAAPSMRPDAVRIGHVIDAAREALGYAAGSNRAASTRIRFSSACW